PGRLKGLAEQVALGLVAALVPDKTQLLLPFDAGDGNLYPQRLRQPDGGRGDGAGNPVMRQTRGQAAVELDGIYRKPPQDGQRRLPRTEAIDGQSDAQFFQLA